MASPSAAFFDGLYRKTPMGLGDRLELVGAGDLPEWATCLRDNALQVGTPGWVPAGLSTRGVGYQAYYEAHRRWPGLGHGADLVLPRTAAFGRGWWPRGRIAGLAHQRQLSPEEEEKTLEGIEHERAEFFRHHFHVDAGVTTRHDVTLNAAGGRADDPPSARDPSARRLLSGLSLPSTAHLGHGKPDPQARVAGWAKALEQPIAARMEPASSPNT